MGDDNVILFRKRSPSEVEVEYYRMITRNWHPQMRQMMFPEHFKHDNPEQREAE